MIEIREVKNAPWPEEADTAEGLGSPAPRMTDLPPNPRAQGAPSRWTWESWSERGQTDAQTLAMTMHIGTWAVIGVLCGVGIFGFPGLFIDGYRFAVWQPLGAALGGALGAVGAWRAWRLMAGSPNDIS